MNSLTNNNEDMGRVVEILEEAQGFSPEARSALASGGGWMSDWYNNPGAEVSIREQAAIIPEGPLGTLNNPSIEIVQEVPKAGIELIKRFMNDEIDQLELARQMGEIKRNMNNTTNVLKK